MSKSKKRVLVAMSGGVDSSVAAYLLKKKGYEVVGCTMCFGIKDTSKRKPACCGLESIEDAKKVCRILKIPHYTFDFSKHLKEKVIDNFISEYLKGRTPNPCVECNRALKFDILLKKAVSTGFDFLATGHYASIEKKGKEFLLKRAKKEENDQSYFLYTIKKSDLKHIIFPLANLTKKKVREIAKDANLPVSDKPASQDICFIPGRNYREFLLGRIKNKIASGPVLTSKGKLLGRHKGACFYTIGQRGGIGIGYKYPLYVLSVDAGKNRLIVGEKKDLKCKGLVAGRFNLLAKKLPAKARAQIRYNQKEAGCTISADKGNVKVIFENTQEAITPGQSAVLYKNNTVLGGGVIEKVIAK